MNDLKKVMAVFMSVVMVLTALVTQKGLQVQASEVTGKLEITCDSVSNQTMHYTRGDKDVTLTLTGAAISTTANSNGKYETGAIENGATVTFTVTIPEGMTEEWSLMIGGARETASTATSSQTGTDSVVYTFTKIMDFSTNTFCAVEMEFNSQGGGSGTPQQKLIIQGAGQTFGVSADGQTLTYAGGTVQIYVNNNVVSFSNDSGQNGLEQTSEVSFDLISSDGKADTVQVRVTPKEGYTACVKLDGTEAALTSAEGYQYVTYDFSNYRALNVNFNGGSGSGDEPGPTPEIPKAPTDAISIELWDNLGNLVDYSAYSNTDDVILEDGAVMEAIGAKIQYSYDNTSWNELSNETLDENLTYDGYRYIFNTTIETVYLKVVSVKNGYLKSKALKGVSDGVQIEAGTVTFEEVYTVNQMGACDFIYDNGKKNIVWSYDPAEYGADGTVTNGTVKVLSAVDAEGNDVLNQTGVYGQTAKGGFVEISEGALVTVQIIPDYGYQFVSGSLNGNVVTASNEISTFTFTMPKTNLHLSALFKESKDQIAITADGVTSGTIAGGANVIDSGNLKLTVANSGMSDTQKAAMQASSAASNVNVTNWLEVDLEQIVNKGNETDVWTTDLEELKQKITITLNVGKGLDATKEYVVVREHEGVYEQIPAVYNAAAGTLTFQSDKFSNYAVGTVQSVSLPVKGDKLTVSKGTYKVTNAGTKNPTVTYTGTTSSTAKTVTIPATVTVNGITYKVTAIADSAFKGNKTITKVTIPKSVTTIGKNTFNGCTKLKTVTIGSSVTSIGANAFKDCKVLTKVTIPSKVTTIGSNAFNGCTKLKTVTVGSKVTTIGAGAFKSCKALTKITLPSKTTKIGANAFNGCTKLKTITIKSKKLTSKSVSSNAFKGVSTSATIKVPSGKVKTYKSLFQKKGLSKKVKVK